MKITETLTQISGILGEFLTLLFYVFAIGVVVELIFGSGVWGIGVIQNLMSVVGMLGNNGIAGFFTVLILFLLFKNK